jgi:hypothetical protein
MRSFTAQWSPQGAWKTIGAITASSSSLGVTARAYATAEAVTGVIKAVYGPEQMPYALLLRFRTDGSNDSQNVLDMWACRNLDDYSRIATLTVTEGTQLDTGSVYYCDTVAPSNEEVLFAGVESSGTSDMIAYYYVKTLGFNRLLFQATTLNNTTVYVDVCELFQ